MIEEKGYVSECKGCKREGSTDIKDHLGYCQYCKRNDNQEFHRDLFEFANDCNLTTCRYNENCKCTNEEKRKECVDVAEKVLVNRFSPSELLMYMSNNIGDIETLKKFGIEIDLRKFEDDGK